MASRPRTPSPAQTKSIPPAPAAKGRGGSSRRGLVRLAARSAIACAMVGCLTVVAGWHAAGLVRSGEIDRMLRMGSRMTPQATADLQARGKLDKGRLKALAATAGK